MKDIRDFKEDNKKIKHFFYPTVMPKKKTNYGKSGFVRQLKGSIFSSDKSTGSKVRSKTESKWRPRKKNLFSHMDADGGLEINNTFSFSVESDTGEYKRSLLADQKKKALKQVEKNDFSGIRIKPSARDRRINRSANPIQRCNTDSNGFPVNPVESFDDTMSRQTYSSKQTTSHYTVSSDPTNFFSKKKRSTVPNRNLQMMSALAVGSAEISQSFCGDEIENENPRSKFYQFTIDENKESTVILPVGYSEEDRIDEESQQASMENQVERNSFDFETLDNKSVGFDPFEELVDERNSRKSSSTSFRAKNSHSLCYTPSPKVGLRGHAENQLVMYTPPPSKKWHDADRVRPQSQPRPVRDHRFPLSPLNGMRAPNTTSKIDSMRSNYDNSGLWQQHQNGSFERDDFWESNHNALVQLQPSFESNRSKENHQMYGLYKRTSYDEDANSSISFQPRVQEEQPIGIQSFEGSSKGAMLYSYPTNIDDEYSTSKVSSSCSSGKPTGLPSNAIMASMLFQRHHNIDVRAVEEKLKAQEKEMSQLEINRGDIPRAIQAQDDMYSCVSSFSDETGIEPWKKPTRDLLNHFAMSQRTEYDVKKYRHEQRSQAIKLFEA